MSWRSQPDIETAGIGVGFAPTSHGADSRVDTAQACVSERRLKDYEELVQYAREAATGREHAAVAIPPPLDRTRMHRLASIVARGPSAEETFLDRMAKRAEELELEFPTVTIHYRDVSVATDALVGSAAMPTLLRTLTDTVTKVLRPASRPVKPIKVLDGVSGVLKPGRMTLLLGPPNAGKSTFLRLLAGRLPTNGSLRVTGSVAYNGQPPGSFYLQRTAAYVDQHDEHVPQLSVADTLEFAWKCQTGGSKRRPDFDPRVALARDAKDKARRESVDLDFLESGEVPAGGLSDAQFDALVQAVWGTGVKIGVVMKLLGLFNQRDTVVGNEMLRGVSGGERKRVTTAEMLVGPRAVLLLDEVSTGLDSATLFSIVRFLSNLTHTLRTTTVIALLQPPPEVVDLFDDIALLTDGHLLYHGPVPGALPFFAGCGFECPRFKDSGSFMQEVTTPIGQLEFATDALRAEHNLPPWAGPPAEPPKDVIVSDAELSRHFWEGTAEGRAMRVELDAPAATPPAASASLVRRKYALSLVDMLVLVCSLQLKLVLKDRMVTRARAAQVLVIALIMGTLWYDIDPIALNARQFFAVTFMSVLFLALGALPQLQMVRNTRAVYLKQRDNLFYAPFAYGMALVWATLPSTLLESVLFSVIVYFLVGFTPSASAFFIFLAVVVCVSLSFSSVLRAVAVASPTLVISNSVAALTLLLLVLYSGFSIVRSAIPGWWIWAYYFSPLSWGLQAIVVNEMTQPRWDAPIDVAGEARRTGDLALESFDFKTDRVWILYGILYMLAVLLVMTAVNVWILGRITGPAASATVTDDAALARFRAEAEAQRREAEDGGGGGGGGIAFEPVTITFIDLEYYVPNPRKDDAAKELQLLRGITGTVKPGVLTALMGGSGAGKTTFMDTIAGRKTVGRTAGAILINGYPVQRQSWSRTLGYVEQMDIHSPQLTVYESLSISAALRLPRGTSDAARMNQVSQVLQIVDLTTNMDSMVGLDGGAGLSTEQRKRLTIAVELVSAASAVFMDEPTSGLDARAAATVMRAVRSVADSGRTVMVTVHQPSIDIFYAFDALLLLAKGGRTVFFGDLGPHSQHLVDYLQAVPGVLPLKPGYNPATWMLEVTAGKAVEGSQDFPALYNSSDLARRNRVAAEKAKADGLAVGRELQVRSKYAQPFLVQLAALSQKFRKIYWRKPDYNLVRFGMTALIALVLGTTYLDEGTPGSPAGQRDVQNVMGCLYTTCTFMGMVNLMSSMPVVGQERAVFYRERASSMYSSMPFALAASGVEVPYILLQALIFCPITFFLIGFNNDDGWQFWYYTLMIGLTVALYTFMGQVLAYTTASQQVAMVAASGLNFLFNIANGFALPYPSMPRGWSWLNRIVPTTWVLYGLAVSQLGDNESELVTPIGERTTVGRYLRDVWGYEFDFRWQCIAIVVGYIAAFRLLSVFALKYLNFQKR